jgi:hypothetical protein
MNADRELLELAAKAASLIGETRAWTPSYQGARPIECTVFNCAVTAIFSKDGMKATIGSVWTNYLDRGRTETVWFVEKDWQAMPLVRAAAEIGRTK